MYLFYLFVFVYFVYIVHYFKKATIIDFLLSKIVKITSFSIAFGEFKTGL